MNDPPQITQPVRSADPPTPCFVECYSMKIEERRLALSRGTPSAPHSASFLRSQQPSPLSGHHSNPSCLDPPPPVPWPQNQVGSDQVPLTNPFQAGLTMARTLPATRTATAASVQGRSHLMPVSQRHRRYLSAQRMQMPLRGAGPGLGWPIRAAESLPQPPRGGL